MSKTRFADRISEVLGDLDTVMKTNGQAVSAPVISGTYSQEGNAAHFHRDFEDQTRGLREEVSRVLGELDEEFSNESMSLESSEPMRAGVIAALASQHPAQYHKEAITSSRDSSLLSLESVYSGLGGEVDVAPSDAYSQESFDETELNSFSAQNIVFNVLASRQDAFAEAFFPTKVIAPSEGGIKITVDRQEVIDYAQHKTDGSGLNMNRRNLIEAYADHRILARPATELVPWAKEDNSADANFVAESDVASKSLEIAGHSVRTRPLKMGRKMNFLGLSQHPGLVDNGVLDLTDQIAPGARLKNVYLKLDDSTDVEIIRFNTEHMSRNQFKKSAEGQGREVVMNFVTESLPLDGKTQTIAQADSALLKTVVEDQNVVVRLGLSVNGNGNLDRGELQLNASPIHVEAVIDAAGEELSLTETVGKAVVDKMEALKATIIGYDLAARRSNSNWRSTGALIDVTPYTESYAIEPGYPISVLTPTDETQNGAKISGMINAARVRNSNNAITTLINYAEQLEAHTEAMARGVKTDVLGAGRHVVKPFFRAEEIDVSTRVESISSHERAMDVSRVLVDAIRDAAYRMYRESNYGPALDLANAGTATKPIVLIGCDAVTERYLNIQADDRLLGGQMDYRIVSTNDRRVSDSIFLTFTRERPGSEDGLSFGVHAYMPELIQRVTTQRGGSTAKNDRVVPRNIHVPILPVMAKLDVLNLKEAIANTTP